MIILNLLPTEKKHSIAVEQSHRILRSLSAVFLSSLILGVATMFAANWYIGYEIKSTDAQIASTKQVLSSRGGDSNTQIETLNEQIKQLLLIQKKHIIWPMVLSQLTDASVTGITLKSVNFDATTSTFALTGIALTRQDLVNYKAKIDALQVLSNIDSPLSDIIQRENINFQLKGKFTYSTDTP
jgi:hypothetical protein